ncbi:uncharacterized protein LOC104908270 [Beta vulgaris subsp. vulgaris]|uniref:uncharacterized protein LOC104908270 n=1 Tax=Beta vulgaris subsp. vulgaris TaxID=3555 RepID=UPI002547833A|nr:uncharacterized protein LOC104908270 [Beta vulgaris subsp. vulgaris]
MTNYPIKSVLRHPELTGRMSKWAIALSAYDIQFHPRTVVKSQALADFVADFSPELEKLANDEVARINQVNDDSWILFVDGSSNFCGAGLGIVLKSPQGGKKVRAICCEFRATNNKAEYEALIAGMTLAEDMGAKALKVFSDSLLIVSQVKGELAAKDSKMAMYLEIAKSKSKVFNSFDILHIPRDQNTQADALANLGSSLRDISFTSVPIVHLTSLATARSIGDAVTTTIEQLRDNHEVAINIDNIAPESDPDAEEVSVSWTKPFYDFLANDVLPTNKVEARRI